MPLSCYFQFILFTPKFMLCVPSLHDTITSLCFFTFFNYTTGCSLVRLLSKCFLQRDIFLIVMFFEIFEMVAFIFGPGHDSREFSLEGPGWDGNDRKLSAFWKSKIKSMTHSLVLFADKSCFVRKMTRTLVGVCGWKRLGDFNTFLLKFWSFHYRHKSLFCGLKNRCTPK